MNAEPRQFTERPGSSRGLLARPYLANGSVMLRQHVTSISYTVTKLNSNASPVTGSLVVADVMLTALQTPWYVDDIGYSLLWPADGALWPDADSHYFIDLAVIADGKTYKMSWQVNTTRR